MSESKPIDSRDAHILELTNADDPLGLATCAWVTITDLTPTFSQAQKDEVKQRVAMVIHLRDDCPGCPDHDAWPRIFAKAK